LRPRISPRIIACMLAMPSILAVASSATATATSGAELLTPLAPTWVISFLLLILWLFVAAILLGPLIRHFNLEPASNQYFSDDRAPAGPR
jgi:Na+/H+-dicarboxylate symporter